MITINTQYNHNNRMLSDAKVTTLPSRQEKHSVAIYISERRKLADRRTCQSVKQRFERRLNGDRRRANINLAI